MQRGLAAKAAEKEFDGMNRMDRIPIRLILSEPFFTLFGPPSVLSALSAGNLFLFSLSCRFVYFVGDPKFSHPWRILLRVICGQRARPNPQPQLSVFRRGGVC